MKTFTTGKRYFILRKLCIKIVVVGTSITSAFGRLREEDSESQASMDTWQALFQKNTKQNTNTTQQNQHIHLNTHTTQKQSSKQTKNPSSNDEEKTILLQSPEGMVLNEAIRSTWSPLKGRQEMAPRRLCTPAIKSDYLSLILENEWTNEGPMKERTRTHAGRHASKQARTGVQVHACMREAEEGWCILVPEMLTTKSSSSISKEQSKTRPGLDTLQTPKVSWSFKYIFKVP